MSAGFDPKALRGETAAVLGLGRSGLHVANLLAQHRFKVLASDQRPAREIRPLAARLRSRVKLETGGHSDRLLRCGFAVKSPGLHPSAPILQRLKAAKIPVFSEIEVSLAFCRAREVIAITGTNGKTTTTLLAGALFKAGRRRAHVLGNVGIPLAQAASKIAEGDVVVLEISSYQLEDSQRFHPSAAALLNVTADHLDHHGSMGGYLAAKSKIFRAQTPQEFCVFNASDALSFQLSRSCPSKKLFFARDASVGRHAWVERGRILLKLPQQKEVVLDPPKLAGAHNLDNAMAAALLALGAGVSPAAVQKGFNAFRGVEHRLEDCGSIEGVRCINDSKATNVDSTLVALRALAEDPARPSRPHVLLILGGLHKGFPYTPLRPFLGTLVKGILTIGSAARKIEDDLSGSAPILPCENLEEAVRTGFKLTEEGDTLLLSPACASFDQFKDFEERGRRFKALIRTAAGARGL